MNYVKKDTYNDILKLLGNTEKNLGFAQTPFSDIIKSHEISKFYDNTALENLSIISNNNRLDALSNFIEPGYTPGATPAVTPPSSFLSSSNASNASNPSYSPQSQQTEIGANAAAAAVAAGYAVGPNYPGFGSAPPQGSALESANLQGQVPSTVDPNTGTVSYDMTGDDGEEGEEEERETDTVVDAEADRQDEELNQQETELQKREREIEEKKEKDAALMAQSALPDSEIHPTTLTVVTEEAASSSSGVQVQSSQDKQEEEVDKQEEDIESKKLGGIPLTKTLLNKLGEYKKSLSYEALSKEDKDIFDEMDFMLEIHNKSTDNIRKGGGKAYTRVELKKNRVSANNFLKKIESL